MNRVQWQQFSERWLVDAKTLLDNRRWSAAYYVAGYAVESALKACIPARLAIEPEVIFDTRRFSENCWTHSLKELLKLAGLEDARVLDADTIPGFGRNWNVVKDWTEQSRYETTSHSDAKKLYAAIADKPNGVMQWIRGRW